MGSVFERMGCVMDPSFQGGLRFLSGTPQWTMELLKVATGFLPGQKAPTAEKHFVVILTGTAQFHLGSEPTLALQPPFLHSNADLRMRAFFHGLYHDLLSIFKQIDGATFLGALEPQLAKLGLGVHTNNELIGMKWARLIQELVQLGLHVSQVLIVPWFRGQLGGGCAFLHTLFLVVFQGSLHQLVHGMD